MEKPQKHLLIVAGEASGDLHAAHLVSAIKSLDPNVIFSGLGGENMQKAGVELYENIVDLAVVGFAEVLKNLGTFKRIFDLIIKKAKETSPQAAILVDYPGFNLRLAKELKKMGIKVIYYISPQVWAWKANRVKLIKRYVDQMIVLFQFEKDFYAKYGMDVICVGHPLVDVVKVRNPRNQFLESIGFSKERFTVALLPGSRDNEVKALLPIMIGAARLLAEEFDRMQFLILKAATIGEEWIRKYIPKENFPIKIISDQTYDGVNASDFCMVASGTATLETAVLQKPMVIVYKTSLLTWFLANLYIQIPYIGLVNVVAGKHVVSEYLQFDATPQKIAAEIKAISKNEVRIAEIKSELAKVRESLGQSGATRRAAEAVLQAL